MKRIWVRVVIAAALVAGISVGSYHFAKRVKIRAVLAAERIPYTVWLRYYT